MTGLLHEKEFSRRAFVKGGGALIIGFSIAGSALAGKASAAAPTSAGYLPDPTQVDSWLTVTPDNRALFKTSQIEVGQGVTTGLLQIVAEELDLSADQVAHSPWDSWTVVNSGSTGGSSGIWQKGGPPLRAAAATARQVLLGMASAQLGVPVSQLSVDSGVVSGGGKSVSYGQLVDGKLLNAKLVAPTLQPGQAPAKPVSQYKLVTTSLPRIDIPAKITGTYTYVHNIRVPGMLHGRVVRPRGQGAFGTGAPYVSVDESSIRNIAGAQVVRKGDFLGVVAPLEFNAIQAAAELKVKWKDTPMLPTSGNLFGKMRADDSAGLAQAAIAFEKGNVDSALPSAAKTVSATYSFQNGMRGVIGPSCAVADVRSDSAVIFTSDQNMFGVVTKVADLLGLPPAQVRVYRYEGASSFGGAQTIDAAKAAALMSQAVGQPVRVQFMRWDEMGWDNYQAAQLTDVRGGVDANGKLVAYDYTLMSEPYSTGVFDLTSELTGSPYPANMHGARADDPSTGVMYYSPNKRITGKTINIFKGYFRTAHQRSGGEGQLAAFAAEQFIDELAYAAGMDPIEFRRQNVSDERWLSVLNAAAEAANWQPRVANSLKQTGDILTGRGYGSGTHGSYTVTVGYSAAVVEIEVNKKTGKITATNIYNSMNAGLAVNPAAVENQMSGGSIMGLSRILHEEVRFNKSRVTSLDWVSYPILRFIETPKVTNVLLQQLNDMPRGVAEPPITPIPAAVANAFFDATGVRMRSGPMTPGAVRATLKAAGVA